jgi:hypothetical protein
MPRRTNPVIAEILRQGADQPRRRVLAALTTGAVESNFRNVGGGMDDSQGWRQERASLYKDPRNLKASVRRFYAEAAQHDRGQSVGELAADVQRPAQQFRGRYAQHLGEARQILKGGGWKGTPGTPGSTLVTPGSIKVAGPGTAVNVAKALQDMRASDQAARPTLTAPALPDLIAPKNYAGNAAVMTLDAPRPATPEQPQLKSALDRLSSLEDKIPEIGLTRAKAQDFPGTPGSAGSSGRPGKGGVAKFEGKQVADWIAPILQYARKQGWKGSVNSGYRSKAEQTRIYNSGVRPAAKPGTSNHEFSGFPGGAVDVSDAASLSQILARSPYRKKLRWAGAKDPVHFSHPHGGSY